MKLFSWPPSPVAGCAAASAHSRHWLYAEKMGTNTAFQVSYWKPTHSTYSRKTMKSWTMGQEATSFSSDPNPQSPAEGCNRKPLTQSLSSPSSPLPTPPGTKCTLAFHPLSASLLLNPQRVPGEKRKALTHRRRQAAKLGLESHPAPRQAWGIKGTAGERTKDLKLWNKGKEKA